MEQVILVDENDNQIGVEEKLKAHQNGGKLHRCFSIQIFNSKGELLLQQRASVKYHCGGLWANTCCSHPRPGEVIDAAAHRRLKEELGFDTKLKEAFTFVYKADFDNGLTEWEYDHVFIGIYDGVVRPSPEEVDDYKWIGLEELKTDIEKNPQKYTVWFKIILNKRDFEKELKLLSD